MMPGSRGCTSAIAASRSSSGTSSARATTSSQRSTVSCVAGSSETMRRRNGKAVERSWPGTPSRQLGVALEQLVDEAVVEQRRLGHEDRCVGVAQDVVALVARGERAHRHDDGADAAGPVGGDHELGAVGEHERDRRALRDPGGQEGAGELPHLVLELAEGDPAVAEDQRLAVAVAPGDVGDEPAEGEVLPVGVEAEVATHVASSPCHAVCTGSVCQPRTTEVGAIRALAMSTSQSGNRFSTSSSTTRPSRRRQRRAQAEVDPVPEGEVRAVVRWMSKRSGSSKRRSSRLAEWFSRSRALPAGTVCPCSSTSSAT